MISRQPEPILIIDPYIAPFIGGMVDRGERPFTSLTLVPRISVFGIVSSRANPEMSTTREDFTIYGIKELKSWCVGFWMLSTTTKAKFRKQEIYEL